MVRIANSLASLRAQINAMAPGRSKVSDGWLGDLAHQGRVSDHNPDSDGIVRAFDITDDPAGGMDALWLREALRKSRDPRIKYVISEGQMFSAYATSAHPAWVWRPYSGSNRHEKHVHVSVVSGPDGDRAGTWSLSRDLGSVVRPPITPDVPEDTDMTPEEYRTAFVTLMREAATRSTPTGRQLADYLAACVAPSAAALVWSAEFGSGSGRQSAAERLALAAVPGSVSIPADVMDQLSRQAAGLVDVEVTVKEKP